MGNFEYPEHFISELYGKGAYCGREIEVKSDFLQKWPFWQVGVTNKVKLFTNRHGHFMASSIETRPKTTLGPISGGTLLVPSCTNMQKTDISEICSEALYCETLSLGSTIGSG